MTHAPPPGSRREPLPEVAGPQAAVTVGFVAAEAPFARRTPPSNSSSSRSLWARAEDEMVAKEQTELDQLVGDLAVEDGELLAELQRERDEAVRITRDRRCLVHGQGEGHEVEREERKRRRKRVGGGVLPEEYCGFLGDDFWSFAWSDSGYMFWCCLVYFYDLLHLAFDCSTLFCA